MIRSFIVLGIIVFGLVSCQYPEDPVPEPYNGKEDYYGDWYLFSKEKVNAERLVFSSDEELIIPGRKGYVVSKDSGKTWNQVQFDSLRLLEVIDANTMYFFQERDLPHIKYGGFPTGYIYKSENGGTTFVDSLVFHMRYMYPLYTLGDSLYFSTERVDTTPKYHHSFEVVSINLDLSGAGYSEKGPFPGNVKKRVGDASFSFNEANGNLYVYRHLNNTLDSLDLQTPYHKALIGNGNYHIISEDKGYFVTWEGLFLWDWSDRSVSQIEFQNHSILGHSYSRIHMTDHKTGYLASGYAPFLYIQQFDSDTARLEFKKKFLYNEDVSYFGPNPGNTKLYLFTNEGIWTKDLK